MLFTTTQKLTSWHLLKQG